MRVENHLAIVQLHHTPLCPADDGSCQRKRCTAKRISRKDELVRHLDHFTQLVRFMLDPLHSFLIDVTKCLRVFRRRGNFRHQLV